MRVCNLYIDLRTKNVVAWFHVCSYFISTTFAFLIQQVIILLYDCCSKISQPTKTESTTYNNNPTSVRCSRMMGQQDAMLVLVTVVVFMATLSLAYPAGEPPPSRDLDLDTADKDLHPGYSDDSDFTANSSKFLFCSLSILNWQFELTLLTW